MCVLKVCDPKTENVRRIHSSKLEGSLLRGPSKKSEVDKNSLFDNYPHKPPNNSVRSKGFPSCPTFVEDNFQLKA